MHNICLQDLTLVHFETIRAGFKVGLSYMNRNVGTGNLTCYFMLFCIFLVVVEQTGGLSNRQKEHKKVMPHAAKKARMARTRVEKKIQRQTAGKQFRGRKAWK